MDNSHHISIRILSQPRYLSVVRAAVEEMTEKMGFSQEVCGQMALAVDEALTNVMRHGYHGHMDQPIWLKMSPVEQAGQAGLEIVIEDQCAGVDLEKIKGRSLAEVRPGGLGVHIITGVMDQVEYRRRTDSQGVRLRMVKFVASAAQAREN